MPPYPGRMWPSDDASDASSNSSVSARHHNTHSNAPLPVPPPRPDDDPRFPHHGVATSTPRKTRRRSRSSIEDDDDDLDALRLSDTESLALPDDRAIETGLERFEEEQHHARLTQQSLASRLDAPHYAHSSLTPRGISLPLSNKFTRGAELYAPSPSTGSSTLVERGEEEALASKLRERDTTVRRGGVGRALLEPDAVVYERGDEDERDERAGPHSPSSSPRLTRRSTVGDLATFIDARLSSSSPAAPSSSTPRRSPRSRRQLPPQTPHAPGAFPSSARKPRPPPPPPPPAVPVDTPDRRTVLDTRQKTPPSNGSTQIHDAFARYITGPHGALTNSAERRIAAMQSSSTPGPASGSIREWDRIEAPDFAGRYSFVPSGTLPVETTARKRVQGLEDEHEHDGPVRPTNLEQALRRVGGGKVDNEESDFVRRRRLEYEQQQRVDEPNARDEEVEDEESPPSEEDDEVRIAQRSAIDFAMARSLHEREAEEEAVEAVDEPTPISAHDAQSRPKRSTDLRSSVRFAESPTQPRARTPSPPPRPLPRSRSTSTTSRPSAAHPQPRSPDLPPLPPLLAPDSPEPIRNRQSALRTPVVPDAPSTPPRQPIFESQPPRSPSPPTSLLSVDPPKSSTPPRRTVQPPSPDATPPRASPSPLARRIKSSPKRRTPSPPPSPVLNPAIDDQPRKQEPFEQEDLEDEDVSIPLLVDQLSAAVRALTHAHASPVASPRRRNRASNDVQRSSQDEPSRELTRRKADRIRNRRLLEEELEQLEVRDQAEQDRRSEVALQLAQAYEVEQELGFKVEELRRSIQDMGLLVGDQVARAVNETLHSETRKRAHWLGLAFLFQLGFFWVLLRLANAQSSSLLDTSFYDPFQPHVFHLPLNPYASDVPLHSNTVALFAPYVSSHSSWSSLETTASILKGSVERFGQLASRWSEGATVFGAGARDRLVSTVPI
ncbi:hypothetical protein JCM11491_005170 [Sporobolomyces phaffii]